MLGPPMNTMINYFYIYKKKLEGIIRSGFIKTMKISMCLKFFINFVLKHIIINVQNAKILKWFHSKKFDFRRTKFYLLLGIKNTGSTLSCFIIGSIFQNYFIEQMGPWKEKGKRQEGYYNYQQIISLRYHIIN